MSWARAFMARVGGLFRQESRDRELEAELSSHVEMHVTDNLRAGMDPVEARRQALLKLGGVEQTKQNYRERRSLPVIETTLDDVRFGLRVLRASPGVTLVAVVTLALGIGANTTVYSVVNGLLLRKPPVPAPDRVMVLSSVEPAKGAYAANRSSVSALDYLDWRAQSTSFASMAAADFDDFTIGAKSTPEWVLGARVSASFFDAMDVYPALGRAFRRDEEEAGRDQVAVLSHELWQEQFGGDPGVIGRSMKVNGNHYTVIGIMPRGFRLGGQFQARFWIPLVPLRDNLSGSGRDARYLRVFARLKPGVDEHTANSETKAIAQRLAETHKATNEGWGADVMSLHEFSVADSNAETALIFLTGTVGFVLLIACTNLANLLLARNSARQREFSIRRALGAGRIRLARQLLTECIILSLIGGGLGVPLAYAAVRALRSHFNWNENALAMSKEVMVDGHVLIFTAVLSILAAILFGIVPAIHTACRDANEGLTDGARGATAGATRSRLQRLLVVAQVALSLFLLVGTGLFVELFIDEVHSSVGFESHNLLTAAVSLRGLAYLQANRQKEFFEAVETRLSSLPEAKAAALASTLPFDSPDSVRLRVEGHPVPRPQDEPRTGFIVASPEFFATTGIPLLRGRAFTAADRAESVPVVIVNEAFAKRFFGTEEPLGRHVQIDPSGGARAQSSEVIGVCADINEFLGQQEPRPELYVPFASHPTGTMYLIVRTRTQPLEATDSLRRAVWAVDSDQAITSLRTMDRAISDSSQGDSLMSGLMGSFALIALFMAACGIFGVLSYLVGQRTHEMGIRLALGAKPSQILGLVIRNGMALVGAGTGLGLLFSLVLPRLVAASFEGISNLHIWALLAAPAVLALVGFLACYVPARRAMRVDPMVALRYE